MTQPHDRSCTIQARGKIDSQAGEFWVDNAFQMPQKGHNLSAFERNRVFLNVDGNQFLDASFASMADIDSDSRSVMVSDFDGDHATDILVSSVGGGPLRLFRNTFQTSGHRICLDLIGDESNRFGIGSRVIVQCGDRKIVRDVFPCNGFMGQSPVQRLIGVGDASVIDSLTVRWPSGKVSQHKKIPIDCTVTIREGADDLVAQPFVAEQG